MVEASPVSHLVRVWAPGLGLVRVGVGVSLG
jgi:hypothetical protein